MKLFALTSALIVTWLYQQKLKNFVELSQIAPSIKIEVRYASNNNFIGKPVNGYLTPQIYMTKATAIALVNVQKELNKEGLGLKVFDAYRPQRAVDHFIRWCADESDTLMKSKYYPNVAKKDLIPKGYIAERSGHSRGSTVDLTIINLESKGELDMGTPWDYFGPESAYAFEKLTSEQKGNRKILHDLMLKHGFKPLKEEWWHFTLIDEPYPDTYFDFIIE